LLDLLLMAQHFFCLCLVQRLLHHLTSVYHSYDIMFFFVGMEFLSIVLCKSVRLFSYLRLIQVQIRAVNSRNLSCCGDTLVLDPVDPQFFKVNK
jgi:Na+/H+ antiporter NhaD/arsenite permease-like protein